MTFELQTDVVRPEVRKNSATTISIFPTLDGVRVRGASLATYSVRDRSGSPLATGTVPETQVTLDTVVSRYDVPVPAITDLDENFQLLVTWADSTGLEHEEIILFDVVLAPLGASVSFSDLIEERPSIRTELAQMGRRIDPAAMDDDARVALAVRVLAKKARVELIDWLRQAGEHPRPYMILDRMNLNPVERFIALREMFASVAPDHEDGSDQASANFRYYRKRARDKFEALHLTYDVSEDLVPDATTSTIGTSYRVRRA